MLFMPLDGDNIKTYSADKVVCIDHQTTERKDGRCFDFNEATSDTWEITCTDNRVLFWNPCTIGLFGNKAKTKAGKCTAGHLYYKQIGAISTGYIDANGPFFAVSCIRADGTISSILVFSKNIGTLKNLALTLHAKVSEYLAKENRSDSSLKEDIIANWNEYEKKLWNNTEKDIRFTVPSKGISIVATSRLSAM